MAGKPAPIPREIENADLRRCFAAQIVANDFYFDFICVNLFLSAFICVLYFHSSPTAGKPAPIPTKMPRGQGGVTRIPYCVLRNDWTEYGIRNTNLCRLAQPGFCEPSATSNHVLFKNSQKEKSRGRENLGISPHTL
ncbi:MAG TPA: hypothetical protein ENK60_00150 [Anaerolineae bacterium]|nr:hypothetical protein [Anaerolineae bacterium]